MPVPCTPCITKAGAQLSFGGAASSTNTSMTVTAGTTVQPNVTLNWQSFNVSAGNSVRFIQPSSTAIALNQIFQSDPSQIFGNVTANGQIYLINPNGIIFGDPSGTPMQVNTHGLIASSLAISPDALANGILSPISQNGAAFSGTSGFIQVNSGASLTTDNGGRIALFAPVVENLGQISTPNGQTLLAAGQKIYLQSSDDPNLRGLVVEVDGGGPVSNAGTILATTGNISMLGMAVNQNGRVTATTSTTEAGSVFLRARDTQTFQVAAGGIHQAVATHTGSVVLGPGSVTEVTLDDSGATAVDDQPQAQSLISIDGHTVHLQGGSVIDAPGSIVDVTAETNPNVATVQPNDPGSSIVADAGSIINVAGGDVSVPMSRNQVTVQLRGNELADSPLQRGGILQGQTVTVDARVGTPLGNVSGYIDASTLRTVTERLGAGGTVTLLSEGSVALAAGSNIDVSGGAVNYQAGSVTTTKLLSSGQLYDIGSAPANIIYDAIIGAGTTTATKWGVQTTPSTVSPTFYPAYTQGLSAGTVQIAGRTIDAGGTIAAQTESGPYQRTSATAPLGGTLILGQPGGVSITGAADFDAPSMILSDPGPGAASGPVAYIPVGRLNDAGVTNIRAYSDGTITLPAGGALNLGEGGTLKLTAESVEVDADITAPGGAIAATGVFLEPSIRLTDTPSVSIGDGVELNVAGTWVNDINKPAPTTGLFINGGQLSLSSQAIGGTLTLGRDVLLDADSGAWVNSTGAVQGGSGGSVSLGTTGLQSTLQLGANTQLRAVGVGNGGTLKLTVPSVSIVGSAPSADPGAMIFSQAQTVTGTNPLTLGAGQFQDGGFSSYSITSNEGSLLVSSGAAVSVEAASRVLGAGYELQPDGADIGGFSTIAFLPVYLRPPASISLGVNLLNPLGEPGHVSISSGASIATDPLGRISVSALGGGVDVEGQLTAPGGAISIAATQSGVQNFDPTFQLWLGANASLDVSGTLIETPQRNGTSQVSVLAGGSISLSSSSYIVTQAGSRLDADGTSTPATLVPSGIVDQFIVQPGNNSTVVGSAAGSVSLAAGEGMVLDGDLRAAAGLPGYYGGSLSVDLTRTLRVNPTSSVPPYPTSPATILIQQAPTTLLPASAGFGSALDTPTYDGKVLLSATELSGSGIDSLSLQADSAIAFTGVAPVNLSLAREVLFNSPTISVSAQTPSAAVSAPALTFSSIISAPGSAATPGTASFTARGENIDLAGATVFAGIGTLTLASSGDIRLLGVKGSGGALSSSGSLELDAQRIYPESLTSFSISVADAPSGAGSIRIGRNGATGSVDSPLSAGGQLTLTASTIDQEGVLQAPLGSIALNATDALHLGPNSITSVHLSGSDVLLGSTVNQTNWYYSFFGADALNTNDQLFGPNAQSFPSKQISLNGASVSVDGGAVVDLSGGGDVLAYEQIPGPGGRLDILSLSHAGSMFAVLPLQAGYGPIDPSEFAGWTLPAGSAVTLLQGADGLSAGTYAILPPRYALLPGAFLITPTSGFANMDPGKTVALADGGIVVPGFDSTIDSGLRSANVSGFIVHPGSYAYQLAQYAITSANTYLPKLAGQLGVNVPQLPLDAGTLDVTGQSALRLGGSFITAPATGGQGAQVNISAQNIEVVTALDQSPAVAEISASDLNNLGAASILLGGTRSAGSKGTTLDVTADSVTLGPGVALSVPQLILIATDNVNLGAGSSVTASGAGAGAGANYLVTGDSGVALFSAAPGVNLTRTYPANAVSGLTGTVITEPGSLVSAAGSIVMDGSQDLRIGGGVALGSGGSLTLSSSSIRLGDGPAGSGLLLSSQELAQFSSADITLNSRGAISFLSPLSLAANNLTLDAASFVSALTDPTASVQLTAQHTLTLQDSTSAASLAPGAAAGGTLQLQADSLVVNSGVINVAGFSQVALNATSSIVGKGTAALNFQGDLAANAPVVTVADDAQLALTSVSGSGNLQFTSTGAAPTENSYLGGALTVSANSILQNGNLLVHGGSISLNATSGVEFGSGSHTSVASTAVAFPGYTALAPAGTISAAVSSGDLRIDAGAILDVSGAQAGGDAGQLAFTSASGALIVSPSAQFLGASAAGPFQPAGFSADVASLSGVSFSDLNGMLNSGSFSGGRAFRFSGAGTSLALDAGAIVNADNFRLVVDDGTINIAGAINVVNPHSAASAYIAASGNVTLASSGSITATSGSTSTLGAEIDLSSEQGGITIQSGAVLGTSAPNATGSRGGGLIHYRLSQGAIAANEFSNAGTVQGSPQQIIEGFQSYRLSDGTVLAQVAASAANPIYAGAVQFMASPGAKALAALGYSVVPGVELDSTGDMEIDSIWNLAGWRFGGAPGYLTLRAGGSINVNASISDGFANATPSSALRSDRSWSINLVAGADLASADLYRVNPTAASGSVVIAPDTLVRTGTGSLSISAAQDIVLSGSVTPDDPYGQGVVYTAGRSAGLELDHVTNPRAPVKYVPIDGGSLTLAAGRDIVGSPTDNEFSQLFVEWYQRQPAQPREAAGTWINYDGFQQNFAAFGGGDLTISAGRDLVRVSGVVPDTARYDATANAEIDYGHGNLSVSAGRDIDSGTFLLSNGVGVIRAGASVTATNQGPFGGPPIGLSLAVMNSSFDVRARGDIVLDTVLNPTLIGQIAPTDAQTDFFLSYSPTASVSLTSLAGNIHLQNASTSLLTADFNQGSILQNTSSDLQIYPATLTAQALRGNLSIEGTMYLAPAANSDLNLVARGNITAGLGIEIAASDIDPASLPGFRNPSLLPSPLFLNAIYTTSGSLAHADPPLHSDASPQAQIVAATGTISGGFWDINQSSFIFAGQDILDLRFNLQNPGPNSVTQVFAGRDIAFADNQSYGIDIQGPGELDVVAGRNIDLGPSFGIVSEGNLVNLGLPAGGANLTVMAGVPPDSAAAPASEPASDHPAALAASVGPTDVSLPGVPTTAQLISLFTLLRDTGRAAVAGQGDFSAGYAAINAMFPPNAAIQGDISMIYSHIYTLDGGDINLVVPHGSVDVGVAQASASVGVQKPPYQLGIVAEQSGSVRALVDGDFLVNSSRVFTLGGGDILIWSSNGSIDAGRGAKTTISAPPPTITIDSQGNVTQNFGAAVAGSGIRGILTVNNVPPGDVDLYAPRGFVIAGDAGIGSAGNITIGAIEVIGANNINFGGTAAGVPVETGGLGASLAGVSSASAGATTAVAESSAGGAQQERAPVADAALSWLDVFITGLGEENCKPDDTDCLKRQQHPAK